MARIKKGLLDKVEGKIGEVSAYVSRKNNVLRIADSPSNRQNTKNCKSVKGQLASLVEGLRFNLELLKLYNGYDLDLVLKNQHEVFINAISKFKASAQGIYKCQELLLARPKLRAVNSLNLNLEEEYANVSCSLFSEEKDKYSEFVTCVFSFNESNFQSGMSFFIHDSNNISERIDLTGSAFDTSFFLFCFTYVPNNQAISRGIAYRVVK